MTSQNVSANMIYKKITDNNWEKKLLISKFGWYLPNEVAYTIVVSCQLH